MPMFRRFDERLFRDPRRHDPYRSTTKAAGTPQCPTCRAILFRGKWYPEREVSARIPARAKVNRYLCPACRQTKDHYAMGVVEIRGEKWKQRSNLLFETIRKTEKILRVRNDQERIIGQVDFGEKLEILCTLPELARQIGRELEKSFHGRLRFHPSTEEPFRRVIWNSDESDIDRIEKRKRPSAGGRRSRKAFRGRGNAAIPAKRARRA